MTSFFCVFLFIQTVTGATQTLTVLGAFGTTGAVEPYTERCLASYSLANCIGSNTECLANSCQSYTECSASGAAFGPAYLSGSHPWGYCTDTNSWVNMAGDQNTGLFTETWYRIRFQAPSNFTAITVNFKIIADNYSRMYFNGVQFAPNNAWDGMSTSPTMDLATLAAGTSSVRPGLNEIFLMMGDCGGVVSFNYRIDISAEAPEPFVIGVAGDPCIICSTHATCLPSGSTATCTCQTGYSGDGQTCSPDTSSQVGTTPTATTTTSSLLLLTPAADDKADPLLIPLVAGMGFLLLLGLLWFFWPLLSTKPKAPVEVPIQAVIPPATTVEAAPTPVDGKKWQTVDTSSYIWGTSGGGAGPMPTNWGNLGATNSAPVGTDAKTRAAPTPEPTEPADTPTFKPAKQSCCTKLGMSCLGVYQSIASIRPQPKPVKAVVVVTI